MEMYEENELLIETEEWVLRKDSGRAKNIYNTKRKALSRRNKSRDKGQKFVWAKNCFFDNGKKTRGFNELMATGYTEPALNNFADTAEHKMPRFRFADCGYDNNQYNCATRRREISIMQKITGYLTGKDYEVELPKERRIPYLEDLFFYEWMQEDINDPIFN